MSQVARPLVLDAGQRQAGHPDYVLLLVTLGLVLVGLLAVYSSSFAFALAQFGDGHYLIVRQTVWAAGGLGLMAVAMRLDYRRLLGWSALLMLLTIALLGAILLPGIGTSSNGATRWLGLGNGLTFQPSELAKSAVILYMAAWLSVRSQKIQRFVSGPLPFVLMIGVVCGLILAQPDLGTATIVLLVAVTMFFLAGAEVRHLLALTALGLLLAVPAVIGASYRMGRMQAFLDPWQDPLGKGFHIIQALIALGSGGLLGRGLGASRQKFFYVPGSHTDAVYAIVGEELGLIGCAVVLALFALVAYRGFQIAMRASDEFGSLLAVGVTCLVIFQAVINVGGIIQLIPFTGVPLPLISYGGSSLAITLLSVGVLLSVSRYPIPAGPGRGDAETRRRGDSAIPPTAPNSGPRRRGTAGRTVCAS